MMDKRPYKAYLHQKQLICDVLAIDYVRGIVVTDTPADVTDVDGVVFYEWQHEWRFEQVDLLRATPHTDKDGHPYFEGCIVELMNTPTIRYEVVYSEEHQAFMKRWIGTFVPGVRGKGQMEHLFPTNGIAEKIIGTRYAQPELLQPEKGGKV